MDEREWNSITSRPDHLTDEELQALLALFIRDCSDAIYAATLVLQFGRHGRGLAVAAMPSPETPNHFLLHLKAADLSASLQVLEQAGLCPDDLGVSRRSRVTSKLENVSLMFTPALRAKLHLAPPKGQDER